MLTKSAKHLRDASQMSICSFLMVSPRQMLPFLMANTFIQTTANDGLEFTYPLFRRAAGIYLLMYLQIRRRCLCPFGRRRKKQKNEVVRFNQGGYICPTHNYEPRTLEPQNSCSFSSEWLNGWILFLVWMDNNHEQLAVVAVQVSPACKSSTIIIYALLTCSAV